MSAVKAHVVLANSFEIEGVSENSASRVRLGGDVIMNNSRCWQDIFGLQWFGTSMLCLESLINMKINILCYVSH